MHFCSTASKPVPQKLGIITRAAHHGYHRDDITLKIVENQVVGKPSYRPGPYRSQNAAAKLFWAALPREESQSRNGFFDILEKSVCGIDLVRRQPIGNLKNVRLDFRKALDFGC